MGAEEVRYVLPVAAALRSRGISVEIYPENSKPTQQFAHCDRKSIPFLSICGADEAAAGTVQIKNLASGEQRVFAKDDLDGIVCFLGK
jgi:histidyl-tRNA synthetase